MKMKAEIVVEASAVEAWRVLGEGFGDVGELLTMLDRTTLDGELGVGAVRTVYFEGAKSVTETLTVFDREAMALEYVSEDNQPPGIKRGRNHWTVEALGAERARIQSEITIDLSWWAWPLGPLMRLAMRSIIKKLSEELKYAVEEGVPHPRKVAQRQAAGKPAPVLAVEGR